MRVEEEAGRTSERLVQLCRRLLAHQALIFLNVGVPDTWHHSNRADSVVVSVAPADSIRRRPVW